MQDPRIWLYFLSALTGMIMVVGGIWLIYKEKIYIDSESKQPIEISTPIGGFKNNYPALTLFALGFFPLIYPIYTINNLSTYAPVETVRIKGLVDAHSYPALIYASVDQDARNAKGDFEIRVPFIGANQKDYKVLLVVNGQVLGEESARRSDDGREIEVHFKQVVAEASPYQPDLAPVPADYGGGRP
ncbi:MAG: hypothetical protein IT180_12240 [Acidobacteria bacterium]|nr:hypothetical protein [Acidobacteriota bacterium]